LLSVEPAQTHFAPDAQARRFKFIAGGIGIMPIIVCVSRVRTPHLVLDWQARPRAERRPFQPSRGPEASGCPRIGSPRLCVI